MGNFYLSNKYDEIPGTLWTKILKDFPALNELQGKELVNEKRKLTDTLKNNTKNYLVGSICKLKIFLINLNLY